MRKKGPVNWEIANRKLFQMLYQYMNENYPNVLSEMIQCAKEESQYAKEESSE